MRCRRRERHLPGSVVLANIGRLNQVSQKRLIGVRLCGAFFDRVQKRRLL